MPTPVPDVRRQYGLHRQSDTIIGFGLIGPFAYDGTGHSPAVAITGSTGLRTTNYVGVSVNYYSVNAPTNAGTYYVSNTVTADANYQGATNRQQFTINPAPLTIWAHNAIKLYGQTQTFAGTEFTTLGPLYGSDAVTGVILTSAGTPANAPTNNYAINPSAAVGRGLGNYGLTYSNGTLAVVGAGRKILFVGQGTASYKSCFLSLCTNDASVNVSGRAFVGEDRLGVF